MPFTFIQELFSSHGAAVLCWTLIHSLWQGLIFVIVTGMVMMLTKKSHPELRYKILSIQFLLFILVSIFTFIWEWNNIIPANNIYTVVTSDAVTTMSGNPALLTQLVSKYQLIDTVSAFLSRNASTIVAAWFVVFILKSIKVISALVYTQHLRTHRTQQPNTFWNNRIKTLCDQLQIKKVVQLVESEIIKVPAVFGHLKPVIFIPLGIMSNLLPQQVEAVLLHELAHIRRNDYLFNMIQNIVETIFFFNPALLWISSVIREEREHCCDDIAITQTKDKKQFIESLIRFRELYTYNHSKYVTAFPGSSNSFVNRITRIAMNKNKSLNPAENIFFALSLVIVGTMVMAFCQIKEPTSPKVVSAVVPDTPPLPAAPPSPKNTVTAAPLNDTLPKDKKSNQVTESILQLDKGEYNVIYSNTDKAAGKETVIFQTAGNEYKLVKLNGEIAYLVVNDEKIPKERLGEYSELLKKINGQLERMKEEQKIRDKEQEKRDAEQAIRDKEQEQRDAEQAIRDREQEIRDREQIKRDDEQEQRNKEQEGRDAEQTIRDKEQEQRDAEQVIRDKEQEVRDVETKKLIKDLVSDKIITDGKNLSFSLTDEEFTVNGVKQSAEVFKKYKTKYTKLVGGRYNFRFH